MDRKPDAEPPTPVEEKETVRRHIRAFGDIAVYEFETPGQLLEDFWREAERVMAERR